MASNNVRKLREAKGLSQEELADAVNLTQGAISYIERMGTTPKGDYPKAIAQALGCRVSTAFPDLKPLAGLRARIEENTQTDGRILNLLKGRSTSEMDRIVTVLEAAFPR